MEEGQPQKCSTKNKPHATLRDGVYRIDTHPDQFWATKKPLPS